ncbi:GDSL-type esterase/lipase family protein [Sphingomonas sp. CJ99]
MRVTVDRGACGKRIMAAMLAALLLGGAGPSARPVPVLSVGEPGVPGRWQGFGWPGSWFEGRFRGTAVDIRVDAPVQWLRIRLDGAEVRLLKAPGLHVERLRGLAPGDHVIRIEQVTEARTGGSRFGGFFAPGRALPIARRAPRPIIEFIGDSFTVGYGNRLEQARCSDAEVFASTDTGIAFGPLAAARLGMDYRIAAISGRGMVRNYAGRNPFQAMPDLYGRSVPALAGDRRAGQPSPAVIVVNLGTNDFSTPLNAGEPWASEAALRQAYRRRYAAFVGRLHAANPSARFILMAGPAFSEDVNRVAQDLAPLKPLVLHFPPLALTGCNNHPSAADHRALADRLVAAMLASKGDQ